MCLRRSWSHFLNTQRSLCPVGMCLKRPWSHILNTQRSLCPVGMCLKRSWSRILTSPEMYLVSSSVLRNIVFSWVPLRRKVGSRARRSQASSLCRGILLEMRAQWNWGFRVTFSLLCCCCEIVFRMCWDTLCIGTGASQWCVLQQCLAILLRLATLSLADLSGMAASGCLESCFVPSSVLRLYCVLQVILGRSHGNCYIMDAIWMLGFARNIVFSRVQGGSVAENSRLARHGLRHRRCAVESCPKSARSGTEGSRWLFFFFVAAVKLCFAYVETLCALEVVHQSDVFYSSVLQVFCAWQLSLCRSQWNGCVKVSRCCGCERNTIVFCSWES